ncbi:MAG: tetratricopeptide repeat protein [Candidatus Omnitrophota bacterium]|jgi:tetratricopeptide (TPR) repeat protein
MKIKKLFVAFISIGLFCFIAYFNSLRCPFIWDDLALIEKDTLIRDWHLWKQVFSSDLYYHVASGSNFYRPLQTLSYIWDYHFWQLNPYGYHLTNVALQVLVSFLVFLFIYRLYGNFAVSFSTASLFALCPLAAESVTYISGRAELLMGLSLLASLLLFIPADKSSGLRKIIYLCLSLFCFVLALFSKELAAVFPFAVLAFVYYFKKEELNLKYFLKYILIFFVVDLFYLALRLSLLNFSTYRPPALAQLPFLMRLSVLPEVVFTYLKLLILPLNLHMSRTILRPSTFWGIFFTLVAFAVFSLFLWRSFCAKRKGAYQFMLFWSLIFFLPQSGILPINAFVSDHFIYLSSISFFLFVSLFIFKYFNRRLFVISVTGLIVFYGSLTAARNFDWKDPVLFYKKIIRFSPLSFQAHNNLGLQYEYRKQYEPAIQEYRTALEIKPGLLEAHSNLANLYFKMNRLSEAKNEYAVVEKIAPKGKAGEVQNNIGCVLESEGKFDEALERYRAALKLDPALHFTHFNIAKLILKQGDLAGASSELLKSLPGLDTAKDRTEALRIIREFLTARRGKQESAAFYNDLGIKFISGNLMTEASAAFRCAIELQPRYADAHYNLGLTLLKRGLKREAAFEFKKANELKI